MVLALLLIFLVLVIIENRLNLNQKNNITNRRRWQSNVEMIVPLLYLGNFWRSLETPLINCEIKVILTWSEEGHCTKPYFPSPGISWKDKKDQVNIIFPSNF